jgi:DNA-binding transcriptional LysR family regulator
VRLRELDLNLLVVFEAIHREQNLTRAAEKLGLSQPALSHALSRLRELLQDPLFARNGRLMVPTPFARTLIGPVREALVSLENSLFPNQAFDPSQSARRFVVGLRDALEAVWLPHLVEELQTNPSQLQLVSTRVSRTELETELINGALDVAIEIPVPVSSAIRHRQVAGGEKLVVVARKGHPALKSSKGIDLERYLEQTHVLVSSRRKGPALEDVVLRQSGKRRRVSLRCQNYHAACQVVRSTDLLLTMPERLARALNEQSDNLLVPFPVEAPALAIHMYWHAAVENDPANVWLREQVLRLARKL